MFRSSSLALLRRAAAGAVQQPQHMLRATATATAMAPVVRNLGTHSTPDAMVAGLNGGVPVRGKSTAGGQSTNVELGELLGRELQEEKELMQSEERAPELEDVSGKIHKQFTIKEEAGSSMIKMHTKHESEKVLVQFDVQDTTEDELNPEDLDGEKIEDYTVGVRGVASVTKGHHKLMFSLVFTNTVWVEKVAFDSQGREWDDETLYWSDFSEYPEDVQDAFTRYLGARHIDDELAVFVSYYAYEKEKENYVDFLQGVKSFVGGK